MNSESDLVRGRCVMKTQNRFEMEKIDRNTSNAFIAEHPDRTDQAERLVQAETSRGPYGLR